MPSSCTATTVVDALTCLLRFATLRLPRSALLLSCSYMITHTHARTRTRTRTRTTLSLDRLPDRPVPLGRLCWLCCAVLCVLYWLGSSRRNSSAVSPTPGPCDRSIICDVIVLTCLWLPTHWKLLPTRNLISRPSRRRALRQLGSLDAPRARPVRSRPSQCHAKPHQTPPFTTSAPSLTPIRTWRPGPPDSTTLYRFRPRENLPCLPCPGRNLRTSASSYLDRRRADPSRAHRGPATPSSWMHHRSLQI